MTVGVVFGSRSVEHEVSIITAVQAMDAMDPRRYDVVPILITKAGKWITGPLLRGSADPDFLPMLAGQAAALSREMAAGDLVRMLTTETVGCLSKTG